MPDCVPAELCAASPWIPRSRWKLWTLAALLLTGVAAVAVTGFFPPVFRPELSLALDPLFQGDQPRLKTYLEIIFWTLSGQLALLVGWHRAHSRLDFRGRYRIWPWAAAASFGCGFCAATNLHVGLGRVLLQLNAVELSHPKLGWLVPAVGFLLAMWWLVDRDVRRSRASVILLRLSVFLLIASAVLGLYGSRWLEPSLTSSIESTCGLFGSALVMLSLWIQGWYVAYVTPDPPAPTTTKFRWPTIRLGLIGWLWSLIAGLFRRKPAAAPTPKRRKKAEETGTTKRKRRTRRTTKPRTRKPVEPEEEEAEEESAEDDNEYDSSASGESDSIDDETYEEDEEEETSSSRNAPPTAAKSNPPHFNRPAASNTQQSDDDEDEDDDDGDGKMYRVDGPSPDALKGLSKRQRRELKKQWREQQRTTPGRR